MNYNNDITSGLGIGGHGSDDYNIATERDVGGTPPPVEKRRGWGYAGLRYDEMCEGGCRQVTVVCNNCGCCKKHCSC